ncbi:MAG: DUF2974 domain-containing protein [Butyrivibrio sp.]|nr:DUF2974 domain-containing protein [Butyrivibrio sp.]
MSSSLSREEVVLINTLLYIENLGGPSGTFLSETLECGTIGEFAKSVLRNTDKIDDKKEYSTGVTGAEYKEILNAVLQNKHLKNIIIQSVHYESVSAGGGRSAFLFDPSANEAIVAFKGTQSDAEWVDNVSGVYKVPTEFQQNALEYFRSLPLEGYDTITVTGHSKGGNKAKFITLMDDRVDNCFSFDGQGFSDEFIETYAENIKKNQHKILNIIAESDFVNILLNDVGDKEFYLGTNYGRLGFAENHCANAILFFDPDGNVSMWKAKGPDSKMVDLDKMLNSFVRSISLKKKENVANMLGNVIVSAYAGNPDRIADTFADERYKGSASDLMAFILRYKSKKPSMIESLKQIVKANNVDTGMINTFDFITNHDWIMELIGDNPKVTIQLMELKNVDVSVITFIKKHISLFGFISLVAHKMRHITPNLTNGADKKAEDVDTSGGHLSDDVDTLFDKGSPKLLAIWAAVSFIITAIILFLFWRN